jgi:hypothetical protein
MPNDPVLKTASAPTAAPQVDPATAAAFAGNIARWRALSPRPMDCPVPWFPIDAPVHNLPGRRGPQAYRSVLQALDPAGNPRYTARDGRTFCNIFVWDATRALGAELPHWVFADGGIAPAEAPGATRTNCNILFRWLRAHGGRYGWRTVGPDEAQAAANRGEPTIALWKNPEGPHGHTAFLLPAGTGGPRFAQAGERNFLDGSFADSFGSRTVEYWTHA